MFVSTLLVILSVLHCEYQVPPPSTTPNARDAFLQAIVDPPIGADENSVFTPVDNAISDISNQAQNTINDVRNNFDEVRQDFANAADSFANFDRDPQAPTQSPSGFNDNNRFNNQFDNGYGQSPNVFEPPSRDRARLNVDEFGNPLPDVINPDTATYDLETGANPDELRCPRNWVEFQESCYKFNRSPPKRWDLAREICQVILVSHWSILFNTHLSLVNSLNTRLLLVNMFQSYRHDDSDKADLVSISGAEEHWFLSQHLNKIDPEHRRWYLSTR